MWNLLLPALAIGGGLFLGSQANNKAAAAVNQAAQQQQAVDLSIAQNAQVNAAPGINYLHQVVADADTLTPGQKSQLADSRRAVTNQLHGSDYAGEGRTAAALFKTSEDNFTNTALANNQKAATGAADTLATAPVPGQSALMAAGQAGMNAAEVGANADIAKGKLYGQAIGDVGSLINRNSKLSLLNLD
jgi:hypothetical protein